MNADLKNFLQPIAQAVAATLFVVFTVVFFFSALRASAAPG